MVSHMDLDLSSALSGKQTLTVVWGKVTCHVYQQLSLGLLKRDLSPVQLLGVLTLHMRPLFVAATYVPECHGLVPLSEFSFIHVTTSCMKHLHWGGSSSIQL